MTTPSPVDLFKHVKNGTQNIKNDCHRRLSDSFSVRAPDPVGEHTALPQTPYLVWEREKGREGDRKGRSRREEERPPPLTNTNSWIRP